MAEAIITRRGTRGIKPLVKSITASGREHYNKGYGFVAFYSESTDSSKNGDVMITFKSTSVCYQVEFFLISAPDNVTLSGDTTPLSNSYAGGLGKIVGFTLSGVTTDISVGLNFIYVNGDVQKCEITVEEA